MKNYLEKLKNQLNRMLILAAGIFYIFPHCLVLVWVRVHVQLIRMSLRVSQILSGSRK